MEEKRIINLTVYNRKYPVRVNRSDEQNEEDLRKAVKLINKKMQQYQKKFSNRDKFDILAMASIQLVNELVRMGDNDSSSININELLEISDKLDEIINE